MSQNPTPATVGAIQFVREGAVGTVTVSNPSRRNAMTRAMWRALRETFERQIAREPGLRVVRVRGEGGHFCAGGDISEYPSFRFTEAGLRAFHEDEVWAGLQAMLDCDLPLVAQIEGVCMGAGVEIASCCDLRLAALDATFGAPIARLGFPMAPREAALVARAAGELTAREMLLAAAVLDAPEMKSRGFLNRVLPPDEVAAACASLAAHMATLAPQAARLNKQTIRALNGPVVVVESGVCAPEIIAKPYRYAASAEHREGIEAFLAKRPAQFPDVDR